jgi:hypothetical protein
MKKKALIVSLIVLFIAGVCSAQVTVSKWEVKCTSKVVRPTGEVFPFSYKDQIIFICGQYSNAYCDMYSATMTEDYSYGSAYIGQPLKVFQYGYSIPPDYVNSLSIQGFGTMTTKSGRFNIYISYTDAAYSEYETSSYGIGKCSIKLID